MLIQVNDIVDYKEDDWQSIEILNSLDGVPDEVIAQITQTGVLDMTLMINGNEVEPKLFASIFNSMQAHIEQRANDKIKAKQQELENRMSEIFGPLEQATKVATEQIRSEFGIDQQSDADTQESDMLLPTCTRVEVIDGTGRAYTNYNCVDVKVQKQDNEKTLKVFIK